jgi:hypothetical protein
MNRRLGMDEARVRRLLELAAATEAPPSRVDVELARRHGRRKLGWRRAGLAGGPAAVVIAVLVAAVAVSGSGGAAPGRGRAPAVHAQVTAPRRFSLLSPYAAFGWLPPGESLDGGTISTPEVYLTAGPSASWALTVYVAGFCDLTSEQVLRQLDQHQQPQLDCSNASGGTVYPVTSPAPRVDGHAAFWTAGHVYLVWQYADRGWAALGPPRNAAAGVVIKVAGNVRYGAAGSPVRFPVQLTGVPPAWRLAFVHFVADAGVLRASQYALTGVGAPSPSFTTDPATAGSSCYHYPDGQSARQTINGYQVTVNHLPASNGRSAVQQVCAPSADGLAVFVSTYGSDASPDAVSIFSGHMRLLGTNPANWTTKPLS